MDLKKEDRGKEFSDETFREEENPSKGTFFVAREYFFEEKGGEFSEAETDEEEVPAWGVYYQGKEKTLLGLFWDEDLAHLFLEAAKNSRLLDRVKEIA